MLGPSPPLYLKNILCLSFQDLVHLKVKQLLIGLVWFSRSEIVLLSNASGCKKNPKKQQTRPKTFWRMAR